MYTLQDFLNDFSPHGVKLFTGSNMLKSTGIEFISVQEYPQMDVIVPVAAMVVGIGAGDLFPVVTEGKRIHHGIGPVMPEKSMVLFFRKGSQFNAAQA